VARLDLVGTTLSSLKPRSCGLCGQVRSLTRAHVPPQAAGNKTSVLRAADVIDAHGIRRPGRWSEGGMWVRGLCYECSHRSGRSYDAAYADFAEQVTRLSSPTARHLQLIPGEPPGARFAPGLVARCVLLGMFAIHPRLRLIFPRLADRLANEEPSLHQAIEWPDQLRLRVGMTHPAHRNLGLLTSGIWSMRVLGRRQVHNSFADVVFWPLTWSLVPVIDSTLRNNLGPQVTDKLADASDWVNYGPDRTSVDLRSLVKGFPALAHPMFSGRDEWVELMGESGTDGEAMSSSGACHSRGLSRKRAARAAG